MTLRLNALGKFTLGAGVTGLLLFGSAGTMRWEAGWRFMAVLFVPMFLAGLILLVKNPELLKKRLEAKEDRGEQSAVIRLSGLMFLAGFLTAGLNLRFSWLILPDSVSWIATAVFLLAYGFYGEVLRENAYLSRTIRVQENQRVVDTGLYSLVRHPMYGASVLMFLSMPLVLGSLWSFLIFLGYPVLLTRRIRDEEALLRRELPGYEDYCRKVRFRMIPYVY